MKTEWATEVPVHVNRAADKYLMEYMRTLTAPASVQRREKWSDFIGKVITSQEEAAKKAGAAEAEQGQ